MDKLNNAIKPDKVTVLKVSKSTLEFIRFEGELEDRTKLRGVLARLDGLSLKISSFTENFKVRACEAKDDFPTRHDWDSFFRDARNMDEMKPGERPDTIHISNLPIRWFCPRHMENEENVKPSENIFRRIFEKFGSVRCVDIPICDPYRSQMKTEITGMKTFTFDQEVMFEGYVQFSEYLGFVKAMDEFRGMKLVRKLGDKNQAVNISVTFDKTKHLSDGSIKRRNIVRDRLIAKEKAKHEEELKNKKLEEEKQERERKRQEELKQKELELQRQREERRKEKHLKKIHEKGQWDLTNKIRAEERKLMIAQRKLESLRLFEALFDRIKQKELSSKQADTSTKIKKLETNDLRNKLASKYKTAQEELLNKQRSKVKEVKGRTGLLPLIDKNKLEDRSPSINSISSDDSVLSDSHQANKTKKKRAKKKREDEESEPSISSSESESTKAKTEAKQPLNPFTALYNPEMAAEMFQQLTMYPYAAASMLPVMAAAAGIRPGFFPSAPGPRPSFPYRGGRFPRRGGLGRGMGRRRDTYSYDNDQYVRYFKKTSGLKNGDYDGNDYHDEHDHHRSISYSRSRSRSRTSNRSRSRSRSRSNHRYRSKSRRSHSRGRGRSRSRSHHTRSRSHRSSKSRSRNRSHRRSRSRSRSKSKSKTTKLVSTRRSRTVSSSSGWSRSRSKSRSRSWSRTDQRDKNEDSKHEDVSQRKIVLQPEKLVRSAKEIQRSVQQKLYERAQQEENAKKHRKESHSDRTKEASTSKRRSSSVDSSKFISPKRKAKSSTPEKDWSR
ncbi:A-kinase anchor protein 17B isoform X3 [Hermetia illucens]|nr:A-kinase anchor protein 17B isoform X3 [Hermetia illucens]